MNEAAKRVLGRMARRKAREYAPLVREMSGIEWIAAAAFEAACRELANGVAVQASAAARDHFSRAFIEMFDEDGSLVEGGARGEDDEWYVVAVLEEVWSADSHDDERGTFVVERMVFISREKGPDGAFLFQGSRADCVRYIREREAE